MRVSEQSWHLRYVRWLQSSPDKAKNGAYMPRDLCSYFWKVVGSVAAPAIGVPWLLFVVGWIIWQFIEDWKLALLILGGIVGGLTLLALIAIGGTALFGNRPPKPKKVKKPKHKKEPGLIRSYMSARKRRVCPLIEVVKD